MQERLRRFGKSILDRWNSFERGQQIKIVVTVAVLLITLIATIYITTRPKWEDLVRNKSRMETGDIENALVSEGIAVKLIDNATGVSVKTTDKDRALIVLSSNTTLNNMEFTFQDALDASGMGSTERVKREAFQRLFKSELERRLTMYDWVTSANAEVVPQGEDNFFVQSQDRPSAAIVLTTNRTPDAVQCANVARMVARSVKGLSMDDIEITDQNAQTLYSGLQQSTGTSVSEYDLERNRENQLDAQIRKVLIPIYDEVKTLINLNINWDKSESVKTTYETPTPDSTEGLPSHITDEKQSVSGGTTDAEPGLTANDNATTNYDTGTTDNSSASSKLRDVDLIYNSEVLRTEASVGVVKLADSSAGVYVFKYHNYRQKYMEDNNLLNGMPWEEFVDSTLSAQTPITIDQNIIDSLKMATGIPNLTVIGFEVPVFHPYEPEPIKIEQYIIFGILALLILLLAYGLIRRTQTDEVIELEPELTVEDLLVSTQLEEEKEKLEELKPIDIITESESRLQLDKFIDERPEVVAALLRNWLNDEWE